MQLHQITLEFDAEQDRLLMRISTSDAKEVALWLTRRCVKLLWPLFVKMVEASPRIQLQGASAEARAALLELEHEKAMQQADFSKPYESSARERPLGAEPILVARVHTGRNEGGNHVLSLLPANGQGINLSMEEGLLHSCCRLLQSAVAKAEWDIKLEFPEAPLIPENSDRARSLN
jgi:hypothetical protein